MVENPMEVSYMKKIGLIVKTGASGHGLDLDADSFDVHFIYGVGAAGLSLIEKALFGKHPGDEILVEVSLFQVQETLGHLKPLLQPCLPSTPSFFVKARVVSVETPPEREVVQAIAASVNSAGCDCGGGGGCGCPS